MTAFSKWVKIGLFLNCTYHNQVFITWEVNLDFSVKDGFTIEFSVHYKFEKPAIYFLILFFSEVWIKTDLNSTTFKLHVHLISITWNINTREKKEVIWGNEAYKTNFHPSQKIKFYEEFICIL
jgi:hypothetical protein